jgi:hypothetical protein
MGRSEAAFAPIKPNNCAPCETTLSALDLLLEGLEISGVLAGAVMGGAIGNAILGLGLTGLALSNMYAGFKHRNGEELIEGVGLGLLGLKDSLAAAATTFETQGGTWHEVSTVAHHALPPLAIGHGALQALVGAHEIKRGVESGHTHHCWRGALSIGLGASVAAASLGAGVPALVAAAGFLAGRMLFEQKDDIKHLFRRRTPAPPPSQRPPYRMHEPPAPPEKQAPWSWGDWDPRQWLAVRNR